MENQYTSFVCHARKAMMIAALAFSGLPVWAAQWEICDLHVKVQDKQSSSRELQVRVQEVQAKGKAVCPQPGSVLSFRPEAPDYQSELPRRQWPKPGASVKVRFRYLYGECKDRGPCRISHYSPIQK